MSHDGRLSIALEKRIDSEGKVYYIGRLKSPISINCENGVAFMIFCSDPNDEELQICSMKAKKDKYQDDNR